MVINDFNEKIFLILSESVNLQDTFPSFGGNTGGWLKAGETEEKYAMTWTGKDEKIFEMPTGGAAIMKQGENLVYFAKKRAMSCSGFTITSII
mmetsp:Transcript_15576/g.37010  ORF Transcript_15576/g.37010 Transcript_15576/m.37010 type:complete len:93 (-) Transcript_15576:221-499(-)